MQESRLFSDMLSETNLGFHGFLIDVYITVILHGIFNFSDMTLKIRIVVILVAVVLLTIFYAEFFSVCVTSPLTGFACLDVAVREPSSSNRKPKKIFAWPPSWFFIVTKVTRTFTVYINIQWCVSQTQQNFIMFSIVLGQHVSILIESSSGPSKNADPYLAMFKMRCGIPNAYNLDITMYKMHVSLCHYTVRVPKFCCVWLIHHCIFIYVLKTSGWQTLNFTVYNHSALQYMKTYVAIFSEMFNFAHLLCCYLWS